ncbi:uncharacterized protein LOC113789639 [Dermatophagoides pteronyssinus]|uniref:Uncharacterized protein n=2 Tax=Dermatophagoides pteronyssinus TaxID=6956 RepID=A0ABQ8JTS2_DERPT|nr:glutaredoxin-C8-like [Dermatophagoides pteronyssinus]KAH9425696.1 hypothetical protein DERP_004913 [Dermatophagoides pteronyssinus]
MSEQIKLLVDSKINSKKVMVFSKSFCPYCTNAKKVLSEYRLPPDDYEVMEIENDPQCSEIQAYLKLLTGASSVPRVFINGRCIGGGDDTVRLHRSGELAKLLS